MLGFYKWWLGDATFEKNERLYTKFYVIQLCQTDSKRARKENSIIYTSPRWSSGDINHKFMDEQELKSDIIIYKEQHYKCKFRKEKQVPIE